MPDAAPVAVAAVKGLVVGALTAAAVELAPRLYRASRSRICANSDDSIMCRVELGGLRTLAIIVVGTAVVAGPLLAWALRLRLPLLHAFPVLFGCFGLFNVSPWSRLGVMVFLHVVIAVAVTRVREAEGQS